MRIERVGVMVLLVEFATASNLLTWEKRDEKPKIYAPLQAKLRSASRCSTVARLSPNLSSPSVGDSDSPGRVLGEVHFFLPKAGITGRERTRGRLTSPHAGSVVVRRVYASVLSVDTGGVGVVCAGWWE